MSWEEARRAYQQPGRQNSQADEDLIARRIIKGLGFSMTSSVVCRLEQGLLGGQYSDDPMFDRARALFKHILATYADHDGHLARRWNIQVLTAVSQAVLLDKVYDQVHLSTAFKNGEWPLIFGRVEQSNIGQAFTPWYAEELVSLVPPFDVLELQGSGYRLVRQEATHFVAQFGPYSYPVIHQVT